MRKLTGVALAASMLMSVAIPGTALADHKEFHNPPGQACNQLPSGERGDCAAGVAAQNKIDRTTPPEVPQ